jgi:hypothetical protein
MVSQSRPFRSPRSPKQIQEEAVELALAGRWEDAVEVNLEGLDIDANDVSTKTHAYCSKKPSR